MGDVSASAAGEQPEPAPRCPQLPQGHDALFANVYINTLNAYAHGKTVPPAWQIAFDTAKSADVNAAQDTLLGINAHVQNDMLVATTTAPRWPTRSASTRPAGRG